MTFLTVVTTSDGMKPGTPTIGTATAGSGSATVAYTAPSYTGKGGAVTYTATSSPGGFTGTGSSPITVSGLSNGTAYTFTVKATTSYGVDSDNSSASNSITPVTPKTSTVEYLVVAGGGGGNMWNNSIVGGGGGAGGYRTASGFAVSSGTAITVTVGGGGVGAVYPSGPYVTQGSNSVFSSITSTGGGYGGNSYVSGSPAGSGGSGGGQGTDSSGSASGGTGTSGQGNNGGSWGANTAGGTGTAGGGGGAGSAGANSTSTASGNGGSGSTSSISGSSVGYAGGGGGGGSIAFGNYPLTRGTASSGGGNGGDGINNNVNGVAGSANTGGGGGGGGRYRGFDANTFGNGGGGGSGVVIIRYPDSFAAAVATTGSPSITVSGGYRIYRWTGNGSITF